MTHTCSATKSALSECPTKTTSGPSSAASRAATSLRRVVTPFRSSLVIPVIWLRRSKILPAGLTSSWGQAGVCVCVCVCVC